MAAAGSTRKGSHQNQKPAWRRSRKIRRSVDLYWFEKLLVVVRFLQIYCLLWGIADRWPWPAQWQKETSFILLSGADLYGFREEYGLDLENGVYTIFVAILPIIVWGILGISLLTVYKNDDSSHPDKFMSVWRLKRMVGFFSEVYFIPFLLHVLRFLPNECENDRMKYAEEFDCNGIFHYGAAALTLLILFIYIPAAPYYFYLKASYLGIFKDPSLHEQSMQSREIEYVLELSDVYDQTHAYVVAPYRRGWIFSKSLDYIYKFTLVLTAVQGYRFGDTIQIAVFFTLVAVEPIYKLYSWQYRCTSTNLLAATCEWTNLVFALFGFLSHNSERNALFVDKTLTTVLRAISVFSILIVIVLLVVFLYNGFTYTISTAEARKVVDNDKYLLKQLREAHMILDSSTFLPPEFVDRPQIRNHILKLHAIREDPEIKNHILSWTIEDSIQALIILYENSQNITLLPNRRLVSALDGFSDRLTDLETEKVVVHPNLQEFFSRLVLIRYLLPDEYINGDRKEWDDQAEGMKEGWIERMHVEKMSPFHVKDAMWNSSTRNDDPSNMLRMSSIVQATSNFFNGFGSGGQTPMRGRISPMNVPAGRGRNADLKSPMSIKMSEYSRTPKARSRVSYVPSPIVSRANSFQNSNVKTPNAKAGRFRFARTSNAMPALDENKPLITTSASSICGSDSKSRPWRPGDTLNEVITEEDETRTSARLIGDEQTQSGGLEPGGDILPLNHTTGRKEPDPNQVSNEKVAPNDKDLKEYE